MTSGLVIFRAFYLFIYSELFYINLQKKNSKTSKVNRPTVCIKSGQDNHF